MQNPHQFQSKIRIRNEARSRFANWLWWPLAVTVLCTGLIFTKGHPFQVCGCIRTGFIGFSPLGAYRCIPAANALMHAGSLKRSKTLTGNVTSGAGDSRRAEPLPNMCGQGRAHPERMGSPGAPCGSGNITRNAFPRGGDSSGRRATLSVLGAIAQGRT